MASTKDLLKRFEVPEHLGGAESKRIRNLPSDTALESNKERQDEEMKSGLKKLGFAAMPYGLPLIAAKEVLKKQQENEVVEKEIQRLQDDFKNTNSKKNKDEGYTASGLPREARGIRQVKDEDRKFVKTFKKGGKVSSASKRADGIAIRGKTKGRFV